MTDLQGRAIGGYVVVSLLGRGGMGEVYRAHDPRLGRDVAIKILPPEIAGSAERVARFEREARLLAALSHSHIGAIYGSVEDAGVRGLATAQVPPSEIECEGPEVHDHAFPSFHNGFRGFRL